LSFVHSNKKKSVRDLRSLMKKLVFTCAATVYLAGGSAVADLAPSSAGDDDLNEIVVTSQRRAQILEDVPIAVTAVSLDFLRKITADSLAGIGNFVPGLMVLADSPTQPHYQLRGIGGSDFGVATDPAVGVYIDGVYSARSGASLLAFNDIDRIEVLRGPQGTLFGRSSAAGAISVITKKPSDVESGSIDVQLGNEGKRHVEAMLNAPVAENMAFRFNLVTNRANGFQSDAVTDRRLDAENNWAGRIAFGWDLRSDSKLVAVWNHDSINQPARPAIGLVPISSAGATPPVLPPNPNFTGAGLLNAINAPIYNDLLPNPSESRTLNDFVLTFECPFEGMGLQSTTDYRRFKTLNREDETGTDSYATYFDTANIERNTSWYQELRLSGNNRLSDWIAGISYSYEHARQTSQANTFSDAVDTALQNVGAAGPGGLFGATSAALAQLGIPIRLTGQPWQESMIDDGRFRSIGVFGDVIWRLTSKLNLTTGVRYSDDTKQFSWLAPKRSSPGLDAELAQMSRLNLFDLIGIPESMYRFNLVFPAGVLQGVPFTATGSWTDVSPRVVLDYHVDPSTMVYLSAAKGFTPGGFDSVSINGRYTKETVWNYEAGLKMTLPGAPLQVDVALYHYSYTDKQSLVLSTTADSSVPEYQVSSSDQEAVGVDLETRWQPLSALTLGLTAAYIDARYSKYQSAALFGYWRTQGQTPMEAAASANLTAQPTGEPSWSFAATADYVFRLSDHGTVDFWIGQSYRGATRCNSESQATFTCLPHAPFHIEDAQEQTNLRLTWRSVKNRWGVSLYSTNVFDRRYVTAIDAITASTLGTPYALVNAPRGYGIDLRAEF
jgi:iron complex outermembrane recepter protein